MNQPVIRLIKRFQPHALRWRAMVVFLVVAAMLATQFNPAAALFTNGGFEDGTFSNWVKASYNSAALTYDGEKYSLNLTPGGTDKTNVVGGPGVEPMTMNDANSTIQYPRFGSYAAVVNYMGSSNNANSLKQTTTITNEDIDPMDGKAHVRFAYAPVLQNPGHSHIEQPYFYIKLENVSKNIVLAERFAFAGQEGVPWQGTSVLYTDWQIVDIALTDEQWDEGDSLELEVIAAGCSQGGHYGYVYVDAFGSFLPGMSVSASGPESIIRGQEITYTYYWANTGSSTVDNVVLTAVAPAHTSYVSNDSGCTHNNGTVTCSLGSKSVGTSGTVNITYTVLQSASGEIAHGNYQIAGDGFPPIIGPLVTTTVLPYTPPTAFSSGAPSNGTYGQSYNHVISTDGDPAPTYELLSGTLPPGLTLNSTTGLLSGTPTAAGTYNFTIRAQNLVGSITAPYSITIAKAATESEVSVSAASPVYGQPIHLSAEVDMTAPNAFTPAGKVQFYMDGAPFGPEVNLAGGQADSPSINSLSAGEHTYTVVYLGDSNTQGSSAQTEQVEIAQNQTTITVASSDSTSVYGQPLQLTATVEEVAPSDLTPVGQVQFYVDGQALGDPVALDESGQATSPALHTLLPGGHPLVGDYTFSATYLGNSNTLGSSSAVMPQSVDEAPTTVAVTSNENPVVYGNSLQVTIQVTADAPSILTPDGSVRLYLNGVPFGPSLTLDANGQAQRTIPYLNLWPGDHKLSAVYTPGTEGGRPAQFLASNNHGLLAFDQRVDRATPVIEIEPDVQAPVAYEPVGYTVNVKPSMPTQGTPTGTVQFYVNGFALGDAVELDAQGQAASPQAILLEAGADHSIHVAYSGDDYFVNVDPSAAYTQAVVKAGAVASILSIEPAQSVVGQPVTVHVKVTEQLPSTSKPDGTVTVSNGVDSCLVLLDGDGTGSCTLEPTSPGSPALVATYSGSANFNGHTSAAFSGPVVSKADLALGISHFEPANPVTGQETTIFFTAVPVAPGWGVPTGEVTLTDQAGRTCTAPVSTGSCTITFDQSGQIVLNLTYSGDANFNPAAANAISGPLVEKAPTVTSLISSDTASVFGQPVVFTVTVSVPAPGAGIPTGQIQLLLDGAPLGDPVDLNSGQAASAPIVDISTGEHTLQALYSGDENFAASTSAPIDQEVSKAGTVLLLESNLNPSPYGLPVLITASLSGSAPSQAIPKGGTVQFIVDGVPYGAPVAVDAEGKARKQLPFTALWIGSHVVQATYSGDAKFEPISTPSGDLTQIVEKGQLVITLEPDVPTPVFGQDFSFQATVAGDGANHPRPTGTVQFIVDGEPLGSPVTLDELGEAVSQAISGLSVGAHTLELIYSGDDNYQSATRTLPDGILVERAPSAVTLSSISPDPVVVGQALTFHFTVEAVAPGAGVPGGTVTVTFGEDQCSAEVSEGSCSLTPSHALAADTEVTLDYAGDESFLPSTLSVNEGPAVNPAQVAMVITAPSAEPVVTGQPYLVSVQVSPVAPGTLIPVGRTITISNGANTCTAVIQPDGSAQCEFTPTSAVEQTLTATLNGGADFIGQVAAGAEGTEVIPASVTVTLVSSANPVVNGAPVQYTATVQVLAPGSGTPAGLVQFKIDGEELGAPVLLQGGVAVSPEKAGLTPGLHAVTAEYLGDGNYAGAVSAPFSQNAVLGDQSVVVDPGEDSELIFEDEQNGVPVEIRIGVPAGSVDTDLTLVLRKLEESSLLPPEGQDFVMNFEIEAYLDGERQDEVEFHQPLTVTITYDPENWKESSLEVYVWNGKEWTNTGIVIVSRDLDANTITFTLDGSGMSRISLAGIRQYYMIMPLMHLDGG